MAGYVLFHYYRNGDTDRCRTQYGWVPGVSSGDANDGVRDTISNCYLGYYGRYGEQAGVEGYVYDWVYGAGPATYPSICAMVFQGGINSGEWADMVNNGTNVYGGLGGCPPVCSPLSASLSTNKDAVVDTGSDSATLTWSYSGDNITGISINGTNVASLSQLVVTPTVATTYTLTVTNLCGQSATASVTIDVIPVPHTISYFRANDKSPTCPVYPDEVVTLSWSTLFNNSIETSNSVTIDQGVGAVAVGAGQKVINAPATDTTYTLTSSGIDGTTLTATVDVTLLEYDDTPDTFAFGSILDAELSQEYVSNSITVGGIETLVDSFSTNDSELRLNGGAWTSETITGIDNGDTLEVKMLSSASYGTKKTASITIGDTSATWSITTKSEPVQLPNAFEFIDVVDAPTETYVSSNEVTITGITQPVNVSSPDVLSGFESRVNDGTGWGPWSGDVKEISNGQDLQLRVLTSNILGDTKTTAITVGSSASVSWSVTNAATADGNPDYFEFDDAENQPANVQIDSNIITITGINVPTTVSATNGALISIDGGVFVSSPTQITNNDTIQLRLTSSPDPGGVVDTNVTIGNTPATSLTDNWKVTTTTAGDIIPDPFYFVDKDDQVPNTYVTSNTILIQGITSPSPFTVTNGQASINGGPWVFTGDVSNGDTLKLRMLTENALDASKTVSITIG